MFKFEIQGMKFIYALVIDAIPIFESIHYYVQVRGGQLWGTDVYTYDSDLVAGMC